MYNNQPYFPPHHPMFDEDGEERIGGFAIPFLTGAATGIVLDEVFGGPGFYGYPYAFGPGYGYQYGPGFNFGYGPRPRPGYWYGYGHKPGFGHGYGYKKW